jgi:hypothetical protein
VRNLKARAFLGTAAPLLALLCVMAASRAAAARDRLAVIVVAEGDPDLGDNLTEAAISSLAERGGHELVGARELRGRLIEIPAAPALETCVFQPTCLARLAAAVDAGRAVTGAVRADEAGLTMRLALVNTATGVRDAEWSRTVSNDVGALVSAVGIGVRALFAEKGAAQPDPPPPSPRLPSAVDPTPTSAAVQLDGKPSNAPVAGARRSHSRAAYFGSGALALAVIAFSAAAVTGSAAEAPLLGDTRAEMQSDLEHRERYASTANALLIAGGVLSAAAAVFFVSWWRADRDNAP